MFICKRSTLEKQPEIVSFPKTHRSAYPTGVTVAMCFLLVGGTQLRGRR